MATPYDEVPYTNLPFSQTRPAVLATVAALHGLEAPDPRNARVLELGCGGGANLAGIAAAAPDVQALGIDLAPTAVATARDLAQRAELTNVRFDVGDVVDLVDARLGEFDYVIVHGLYAWGDGRLRDATLAACRAHLAPTGLAFVSYTTHPGGHQRRMLREMALWHARGLADPRARAGRARELFELLDRLEESDGPSFYPGALAEDLHALVVGPPQLLIHDLMSPHYEPVWLVDFAAAAERHGLEHVADALPESSREPPWSDAVAAFVDEAAGEDRVAREQYYDIVAMRRFRQSVLAHAGRRPTFRVERTALRRLLVASEGEGVGEPPSPLLAMAMDVLARAPAPLAFAALRSRLDADPDALAEALVEGFDSARIGFHATPPAAAPAAGPRPRASALARSQAQPGARVTSLFNSAVRVDDEPTARLLRLLDGTRDRAALMRDLTAGVGPVSADDVEGALARFARAGLLHE